MPDTDSTAHASRYNRDPVDITMSAPSIAKTEIMSIDARHSRITRHWVNQTEMAIAGNAATPAIIEISLCGASSA